MEKKKKSWLKKIFIGSGITLLIVIGAMIAIPFFFKDKLKDMVIDEANKSLTATVSLGDFDLTWFSTFPNLTVQLIDTKIVGKGAFEGVELIHAKNIKAQVKLWDVISGDQISIQNIALVEPKIDVRILKDGTANYDITIPDSLQTPEQAEEPSNFKMSLQKYSIEGGEIRYDDREGDMFAEIINLNHEGKGDLTADIIDFQTKTTMDELTYSMSGIPYLTKVKTDAEINLLMEFTEKTSKFSLKENTINLNNLKFAINGFYEMLEGYDNMDLTLDASKATFKDFLSLIPTFYQSGYESMVTKGNLALSGFVKGKMDDVNMPGWDFNLAVDNAQIKYPDVPGSINNIALKAGSKFVGGPNMDLMTLDVPKFHADFVGNVIDATLKMRNPMTDPLIDSKILAKVDLSTLGKVMPLAEGESYNGKLDADVTLNGRMSAIETENYEAFNALGTVQLSNMRYKSADIAEAVDIKTMLLRFSPQNLALESLDAKMGASDFQMKGTIDNYLGYVFRDELLKGKFAFNSTNLDLDQLMGPTTEVPATETTPATTETTEPLLIPGNIDFDLMTNITNLKYDGMNIKNVNGGVRVKEEVAYLDNLTMNTMGGTVGLKGNYNTTNPNQPKLDFAYDLQNIDIQELASNFVSIEKLAPIAKYAKGNFSSKFNMTTLLQPSLEPVYNSLTGAGDFFTKSITVSGFKPLEKIGDVLKMNSLNSQTIKDLKTYFKFKDGKLNLTPFDVKLGKIATNISGSSSFEQDIDYDLLMNVPKDQIPGSMIKAAEEGIAKLNSLAPKLNLASLPDVIPVKVRVIGKMTDPKVTTDFKEALMKASGSVKDNLINKGKDLVNQAKDSVKTVVTNKVNEVREDLNAKKKAIIDDAKVQADKIRAEGKKQADAARASSNAEIDKLMAEAGSNPIKKKAAELAGNKLKKEADQKAGAIETAANKKADDLMATAQAKADAIK
ncbi:MAG: AsmA-like C-terminal region-containing protein [Crocinitomicaceae bacterium]